MKKILLVEDDLSLGQSLLERLSKEYQMQWEKTFAGAWKFISENKDTDLYIFDVGLPDGDGFTLAQKAQTVNKVPLIFLTAQADAQHRLQGFEIGAEEYIPKPFHLKELLMRVKHVLALHIYTREISVAKCLINFTNQSVTKENGEIEFPSVTDMKVLQFIIERSPRAVSRDEIMDAVWGVDKTPSIRTVDNIIVRLRQLFGPDGEKIIRSVRGLGYQWSAEGDKNE